MSEKFDKVKAIDRGIRTLDRLEREMRTSSDPSDAVRLDREMRTFLQSPDAVPILEYVRKIKAVGTDV